MFVIPTTRSLKSWDIVALSDSDGWSIQAIDHRLEELTLRKNRLIMIIKNDPKRLGKEILQVESLIRLNEEIKNFLLNNDESPFH